MPDEQAPRQQAEGEGIAQADRGGTAIVNIVKYADVTPRSVDPEALEEAQTLLETLPLDRVPNPATLPGGSVAPPMIPNPMFVGREEELKDLAAKLKAAGRGVKDAVSTAAVTGLGGVGKTQIAGEFAHRYGRYFKGGVYWLNLADPGSLQEEIARCGGAGAMRLRPDFDHLTLQDQVREVMSAWQGKMPRLLVFDNCDDRSSLGACRPTTGGCRVLVTSRGNLWTASSGVAYLPLEVLGRQESVELLRSLCEGVHVEEGELEAVAEELGDLPLALDLAGRFLSRYRHAVSPSRYVEELRSPNLLDHPSLRQVDDESPTGHEMDVGRTFVVSYERLDGDDPVDVLAIRLLARASRFAPGEPIPRGMLLSALDPPEGAPLDLRREDALRRLTQLGLLTESEDGSLRMHRLVAAFARGAADDHEAQPAVEKALGDETLGVLKQGQPIRLLPLIPHLRHVARASGEREDYPAGLVHYALGMSLYNVASYDEALSHVERAASIVANLWGPVNFGTLRVRNDLAVVMKSQGDIDGALGVYEAVLRDQRRELGERHPDVASTLNNVGSALREKGLYHEVLPRYREALGIREEALAKTQAHTPERRQLLFDVAESADNIGAGFVDLGRYREASTCFERAMRVYEVELNLMLHRALVGTARYLGRMLRAQKNYREARRRFKQALTTHRAVAVGEDADHLRNVANLGTLLKEQADLDGSLTRDEREESIGSACACLQEALGLSENLHGEEHPLTGGIARVLAEVYEAEGRQEQATSHRQRADAARKQVFERVQAGNGTDVGQYTTALLEHGLHDEATAYEERALSLHVRAFGAESPQGTAALFHFGWLLRLQGRDAEACPYLERAVAIREKYLGRDDPVAELMRESLDSLHNQ